MSALLLSIFSACAREWQECAISRFVANTLLPTTVTKNLARPIRSRSHDLPAPYATSSSWNWPRVRERPENAWPQAPAGFKVALFATSLDEPRVRSITAPNGDIFLAESHKGDVKIFRGITAIGKPGQTETFVTGL